MRDGCFRRMVYSEFGSSTFKRLPNYEHSAWKAFHQLVKSSILKAVEGMTIGVQKTRQIDGLSSSNPHHRKIEIDRGE